MNNTDLHQQAVDEAVGVAAENELPDKKHARRQGGRVEHTGQNRPHLGRHLVDQPGDEKAEHIAERTRDDGKGQGVFQGDVKHVVVRKQADIVFKADKGRGFKNVVIGEAERYRCENREYNQMLYGFLNRWSHQHWQL